MSRYRRLLLYCFLFVISLFFIILFQEFTVLDSFEYNFPINKTLRFDLESNEEKNCNNEAIDLVYSWVNGSDLSFKRMVRRYQQLDSTDQCAQTVETPFLLIIPQVIPSTYERLVSNAHKKTDLKKSWIPVEYKIKDDLSSSLFFFEDIDQVKEYLIKKPKELHNYKVSQLYLFKPNCNLTSQDYHSIKLMNTLKINRKRMQDEPMKFKLIQDFNKFLKVDTTKSVINYEFEFDHYDIVGIDSKYNVNGLDILANEYAKYQIEFSDQEFEFKLIDNSSDDASGQNRFSDKDELKYSLRSVEKYANWVRNIYIVTNGQIPNWLNTSNSKIKIVDHKDIYSNQSHLPTFNSASIECHLHRIKGLSRKFLYLNDDFMFGQPVYLEDFYSRSKGYLIRMGWSVPNCALNCPTAWLSDGICDKACNTSICLYDGGDCLKKADQNLSSTTSSTAKMECKEGCQTLWLSDEHCDLKCNNLDCGFDLGDCKTDQWQLDLAFGSQIYNLNQSEYDFNLEPDRRGIYLNMSSYLSKSDIVQVMNNFEVKSTNESLIHRLKFNQMKNCIFLLFKNSVAKNQTIRFDLKFRIDSVEIWRNISLTINFANQMHDIGLHTQPTRRLMDFYADSLAYSNYVINKKYRIENRKVPAHMPILLDRDILERMNIELYDEIEETSSHRFRNSRDLQFAFTYFYFLMSEQKYPTLKEIVQSFDRDNDGKLGRNEARTFFLATTKNQFEEKDFEIFWNETTGCMTSDNNRISIDALVNCGDFVFLSEETKVRKKNKYVILKMDDVSFNQIGEDLTALQTQLDKVRKSPTQFICINDNVSNANQVKIESIKSILHDFYESILPLKSRFENSQTRPNFKIYHSRKSIHNPILNHKIGLIVFIFCSACICLFSRLFCYKTKKKFSSINEI